MRIKELEAEVVDEEGGVEEEEVVEEEVIKEEVVKEEVVKEEAEKQMPKIQRVLLPHPPKEWKGLPVLTKKRIQIKLMMMMKFQSLKNKLLRILIRQGSLMCKLNFKINWL